MKSGRTYKKKSFTKPPTNDDGSPENRKRAVAGAADPKAFAASLVKLATGVHETCQESMASGCSRYKGGQTQQ